MNIKKSKYKFANKSDFSIACFAFLILVFSSPPSWPWWTGGSNRKWKLAFKLPERDSQLDLSLRIIWWSREAAWLLAKRSSGISTRCFFRCCTNWDMTQSQMLWVAACSLQLRSLRLWGRCLFEDYLMINSSSLAAWLVKRTSADTFHRHFNHLVREMQY